MVEELRTPGGLAEGSTQEANEPERTQRQICPWSGRHTFGLFLILFGIGLVGLLAPGGLGAWLGILVLLAALTGMVGHGVTGFGLGCLIDARNRLSLARLQMISWTLVLLSAFLAGALANISTNAPDPLRINVPQELWALMGISLTSMIGTPLITSLKKDQKPRQEEKERTLNIMSERGEDIENITNDGKIMINDSPSGAGVSDLFRGDETANAAQLDLGKLQMFYFTVVLVFAYSVQLGDRFLGSAGTLDALPALSTGMLALLAISHAGYLTYKAIP